ncbi:MAG TPA: YraN family protein [Candidatus Hydrogenedentes bacterium]|nr:YraN family protein [Candidatus Hydrogenedentota bacterium]HOK89333.1 YraN family protein [Candidatus Hydrogenedentota bacterium]HOV60981.1 YraN family protein [Candidatus Hydrogenedentota bacterium]
MWPAILGCLWARWWNRGPDAASSLKEKGDLGESIALRYLRWRGWRLLDRNWRVPGGEIDLVVRRGRVVAFVEVRGREDGSVVEPERTVTPEKQRHVRFAAKQYLARKGIDPRLYYRFDVIAVNFSGKGRPRVTHYPDAFRDA